MSGANASRLAVLLFTDLVDSTELNARLGSDEYTALLARHNELFESACAEFHGETLKHTGDGYFAAFKTSSDAVRAALRFQQSIRAEPWPRPIACRVGIHVGEVAVVEMAGRPDVVGVAADLAARVMSLADGGQILMTRMAFNDARQFVAEYPRRDGAPTPPLRWIAHGPYLFKSIDEPMEIFEVGGEGISPLASPKSSEKGRRVVPHDQEQTLGWRPAVGLAIEGRPGWTLDSKLGEGGFGEVWLGAHERTKQRRVFKFCFDADRLRSFKRELTLFRLLRDALGDRRDIARLYEVKLDNPPFFLESEYTNGGNLLDWTKAQGGAAAIPLARRLEIVAQVADAVAAAHSVGVLHKDIKPSNVLIQVEPDDTIQPRLSDFGIGFLADKSQLAARHITETGFTVVTMNDSSRSGTRMYAPPEMLAGRQFTVQGDIYALGVLLYQMVVGDLSRPIGTGWERDIDDDLLRQDIAECVDREPSRRITSAAELAVRLRTLDDRRRELADAAAQRERLARRSRMIRGGAVALVALLALLGGASYLYMRERNVAREQNALRVEADSARDAEADARARAMQSRDRARKAVNDLVAMLDSAEEIGAARGSRNGGKMKDGANEPPVVLIGSVVTNYRAFIAEAPNDTLLRADLATYLERQARVIANYETIGKDDALRRASDLVQESRRLIREVIAVDPRPEHEMLLATSLTFNGVSREGEEAKRDLDEAMQILRRLGGSATAGRVRDDAQLKLAALLHPEGKGIDPTSAAQRLGEEISLLESVRQRLPDEWQARSNLATAYQKLAEVRPGTAIESMSKAIEVLTESLAANGRHLAAVATGGGKPSSLTQSQRNYDASVDESRLATLQVAVATQHRKSKDLTNAKVWAQRAVDFAEKLSAGRADRTSLADRLPDAYTELAECCIATGEIDRAEHLLERALTASRATRPVQFDEEAWDRLVRFKSEHRGLAQALTEARASVSAFSVSLSPSENNEAALSRYRLANLEAEAKTAGTATTMTNAKRIGSEMANGAPYEALRVALVLCRRSTQPPTWQKRYLDQSIELIQLVSKTNIAFDPEWLASQGDLESFPAVKQLVMKLPTTMPTTLPTVVDVSDILNISRAARENASIRVRGTLEEATWNSSGSMLTGRFRETPNLLFRVHGRRRIALELKLGGDLQDKLPGAYIDFQTSPVFSRELLYTQLDEPGEIVEFRAPATRPSASRPSHNVAYISTDDSAQLLKLLGQKVTVQGPVVRSAWSGSGKVLNIEFDGPSETRLQAFVFSEYRDAFDAQFGGDAARAFRNQTVRITGIVQRYGGKIEDWRGRLQISLERPEQASIVRGARRATTNAAPSSGPATTRGN